MMYIILGLLLVLAAIVGFVLLGLKAAPDSVSTAQSLSSHTFSQNSYRKDKINPKPNYANVVQHPLMDEHEIGFFHVLREALPHLCVLPQVAFSAIIQPQKDISHSEKSCVLGYIKNRRFDYLICDPVTFDVLANIELDGRAHEKQAQAAKDAKRDKLVEAAGYRVIRYSWRRLPTKEQITASFGLVQKVSVQF